MGRAENLAAVERFRRACRADADVVAAFLGGSYAARTDRPDSDIDLYLITERERYDAFAARLDDFMASWSQPVSTELVRDFEGLGFDLLPFRLTDGVRGELALAHTGNFRSTHGGPHRVLTDPTGLLDGVVFPQR